MGDNSVNYETVACPAEIVAKSGCSVTGYSAPQLQPVTIKPTTTTAPKTTTTPKANAPTTTTTPTAPKKASDIYSAGGVNSSVVDEGDSLATASMADGGVAESTEVPGAGDAGSEADAMGEEPVVEVPVVEEDEEDDTCEV